jgi:hypothetical protein
MALNGLVDHDICSHMSAGGVDDAIKLFGARLAP